ncbi:glycoside hydrolase family 1 protein [Nocardioides montaniterrae]
MQAGPPGGRFPSYFDFGVVTAAAAVEGASGPLERGRHVWDTYADRPGRILDGSSAAVACDHTRHLAEDLDLVAGLGVSSYRFSIGWSRVMPEGRGRVNAEGLDFYDRLVDGLLERGVNPVAVLHHWDLPQALEDRGGWLARDTADAFAEYAAVVAARLADRVHAWVPIAEPAAVAMMGYGLGEHAPGRRLLFDCMPAVHHLLLAHGRAVQVLRAAGATSVGCVNAHAPVWPASVAEEDIAASKLFDSIWNLILLEPMVLGRYPEDIAPIFEELTQPGDLETIRQPLDFYGVSYYGPHRIGAARDGSDSPLERIEIQGYERTLSGWPVVPAALGDWLEMATIRYGDVLPPFVIAECGAAFPDPIGPAGIVDDQRRIAFLAEHLAAVAAAIGSGVDVRGFWVWSLLDGWEWDDGLVTPFGLVHVDHTTQVRTPKASYAWLRDLIAAHRNVLS